MAWNFGLLESPFRGGNETLRLLGILNGKIEKSERLKIHHAHEMHAHEVHTQ
jgi:hypothetical protein